MYHFWFKAFCLLKSVFHQFDDVYGHDFLWVYPVWGFLSFFNPYTCASPNLEKFQPCFLQILFLQQSFSFYGTPMTQIQTNRCCELLFFCFLTSFLYIFQVGEYLLMCFMFTDSSFLCHLCTASEAIHWTPYSVPNVPSEFLHCFSAENFHLSTHLWGPVPPHRAQ